MTQFPASPFWRKLSGSEPLDPNTAAIVARFATDMGNQLYFGAQDSWSHPIYNGCATEYPELTVKIRQWGNCNGAKIRLATTARPEGMASMDSSGNITLVSWGDGHLSVQEKDGYQYDFWQVRRIGGGIIESESCNRTLLNGNGFGGGSVLNHALGLGDIRGQDLVAGIISQGLFAITRKSNGQRNTTEFGPGGSGSNSGFVKDRPAIGQRMAYRITDAQISAKYLQPWQRTIAKRFRDHGIVFGDTGGGCLKGESRLPWITTGQLAPLVEFGKQMGNGGNFQMPIDWSKVVVIKNGA
jgi:hypothetical protein